MKAPFVKRMRRGMRLSSRDFNSIRGAVNGNEPVESGYSGSKPAPCMFYTAEEIPPYSIFPLAGWMQDRVNSLETCFLVEKYNESEGIYYDGYFGTNGSIRVKAGDAFIGHVIEHTNDHPVVLDGYSVSDGIYCGFKDGSWKASQQGDGLCITGKCPFGEDIYFVRRSQADCCDDMLSDKFVCLDEELTEGGSTTAKEWQTDDELTVYASPLLCDEETVPACSMVQVSWFPQYQKWYVVAIGGTCHCECDRSDQSTPPESTPQEESYPEESVPDYNREVLENDLWWRYRIVGNKSAKDFVANISGSFDAYINQDGTITVEGYQFFKYDPYIDGSYPQSAEGKTWHDYILDYTELAEGSNVVSVSIYTTYTQFIYGTPEYYRDIT